MIKYSEPTEPPQTKTSWTIGMSQCSLNEPWRVQMNADIKKAAEDHPELTVIYKDANSDTLKQRSQVEEYISAGVDLIIISPKEAAPLTPVVAEAYQSGIPVIVLDRRVLGDQYTCFIGADNVKIGKAAIDNALAIFQGNEAPKEVTLSSRFFTQDNIEAGGELIGK